MPQEAIYSSSRPQELQPIVTDSLDQFGRERVAHFSRDLTRRAPVSTRFAGFPFGLAGVAPSRSGAGREHLDRVDAAGALG